MQTRVVKWIGPKYNMQDTLLDSHKGCLRRKCVHGGQSLKEEKTKIRNFLGIKEKRWECIRYTRKAEKRERCLELRSFEQFSLMQKELWERRLGN